MSYLQKKRNNEKDILDTVGIADYGYTDDGAKQQRHVERTQGTAKNVA